MRRWLFSARNFQRRTGRRARLGQCPCYGTISGSYLTSARNGCGLAQWSKWNIANAQTRVCGMVPLREFDPISCQGEVVQVPQMERGLILGSDESRPQPT